MLTAQQCSASSSVAQDGGHESGVMKPPLAGARGGSMHLAVLSAGTTAWGKWESARPVAH